MSSPTSTSAWHGTSSAARSPRTSRRTATGTSTPSSTARCRSARRRASRASPTTSGSRGRRPTGTGTRTQRPLRFRGHLDRFVRFYKFLSQIVPYLAIEHEKLFQFARFVALRIGSHAEGGVSVADSIELTHYRLVEGATENLRLSGGDAEPLVSISGDATGRGAGGDVPMGLLGELVEMFNDRIGAELSDSDAIRPVQHLIDKAAEIGEDEGLHAQAIGNSFEDFQRGKEDVILNATLQVKDVNDLILKKLRAGERSRDGRAHEPHPHRLGSEEKLHTAQDIRYTPSSAFETFPWPQASDAQRQQIGDLAREVIALRSVLCSEHAIGLTMLYNRVDDGAFDALRSAHRDLDLAVIDAFGWEAAVLGDMRERNRRLYDLNAKIVAGAVSYRPF
jgi:hypothetical protein